MFKAQIQKYYYDFFDTEYEYLGVDKNFRICEKPNVDSEDIKIKQIKELINIFDGKLNRIGDGKYSLSKTWFLKATDVVKSELKKNIFNYFKHNVKTKSNVNGWTTFKDISKKGVTTRSIQSAIKGAGYSRGFIPINMRASNDYKHKESMAYVANRYMNPFVKKMFAYKGIKVNEDLWALSEMLQWLWRGCIRENKPMNVYVPSKRMRELMIMWLDGEFLDIEKSLLETIYDIFDIDIE